MQQEKQIARGILLGIFVAQILFYYGVDVDSLDIGALSNVIIFPLVWFYYLPYYASFLIAAIAGAVPDSKEIVYAIAFIFGPIIIELIILYLCYKLICRPLARYIIRKRERYPTTQP